MNRKNSSPTPKRTKEEHRQYLREKKQAEEKNQKEIREEIWAQYKKSLSVKAGDVIFTAEGDLFKLWSITLLCFSVMGFTVYMLGLMNERQLIADFGTVGKGLIFQLVISLFSSILFLSIWYFLHNKYVIAITLLADKALEFKTWGMFGYKKTVYPKDAWIMPAQYHEGRTESTPYSPSVNAPYQSIRPYGKKKRLIISDSGKFPFGVGVLDDIINPNC